MRYAIIPAAVAALLAGCGSDDTSSSAQTITGQVIGSYFSNAVVCADANHNGRCDSGEASTRSAADGSFTLTQVAGADYVAEIGTDAKRIESGVASAVTSALVFRTRAEVAGSAPVLSALSTFVAAEMDNGRSADDARQSVADRVGVDASKVLSDYNREADPVAKGLIKAWAEPAIATLQDSVRAAGTGGNLANQLRDRLAVTSFKGSLRYAWTQLGADDTQPFSQLEITGISSGALSDDPSKVTNGSATFTTSLQTGGTLNSSGAFFARAIVAPDTSGNASCPDILIDGSATPMTVRAPIVSGVTSNGPKYGSAAAVDFKVLTCEAKVASGARSVAVAGRLLKVPRSDQALNRIVVIGDTGCRLKGPTAFVQAANGTATGGDPLQDCTSEAAWPWPKIARVAASFAPDLVIHNGDLHYREGFPEGVEKRFGGAANAANGGSEQDNTATIKPKFVAAKIDDSITYGWRAWEEDFFKAAGPLLSAAPWAITRGNHELCDRAGQGWFRFLDPRRFPDTSVKGEPAYDSAYVRGSSFNVAKNCSQATDPVSMTLGDLQLVLLDVGMMNDVPGLTSSAGATNGDHVRVARQLSAVAARADSADASKVTWVVSHKPFFAYAGSAATAANTPTAAVARTWQLQKAILPGSESVATGNGTLPANTQMTHAGHIHGFQLISHPSASNLPMSVLMGTTGDNLEGLIEANSGSAYATPGWGNAITSGKFPWLDQTIAGVLVTGAKWYGSFASWLPENFSSSPISGTGKKETATMQEYSFLVIDRVPGTRDWKMQVYDKSRTLLRTCTTSGKTARCDG